MQKLQGIAVSPGIAIGEALVMDNEGFRIPRRFVARDAVDDELERLEKAIAAAAAEISGHRDAIAQELGEKYAAIFDAHLQMLQDARLRSELEDMIRAPPLLARVCRQPHPAALCPGLPAAGKRAPGRAGRRHLRHREAAACGTCWAAAAKASPISPRRCSCWPTTSRPAKRPISTATSSAASSPRSAGRAAIRRSSPRPWKSPPSSAPALPGRRLRRRAGDHRRRPGPGDPPARRRNAGPLSPRGRREPLGGRPAGGPPRSAGRRPPTACTSTCYGNIEFPYEVDHCVDRGADGIGLYRTEFLYLGSEIEPTEEVHYQAYSQVVAGDGRQAGHHPHLRPRRRQDAPLAPARGRTQPLPGPAQHPPGAAAPDDVPHAAAGDSAGQRAGQPAGHVPLDLHAAGTPPGQDGAGRRDGRPRRARHRRSIATCPWA